MSDIRGLQAWMRVLSDQDLPTLNSVVKAICELSDDNQSSTHDLTQIILRDADLTSRVLKIANSVHYNRSFTPIKTISRAIVQIGFINLKNITLASSLIDSFLKGKPRELLIQRLAKSFHAAVQARAMVPYLNNEKQEQVFIAALLRHIGELAILSTGREAVEKFISARDLHPENELGLSMEYLGVDIHHLNKSLIREWSLGELVTEACDRQGKHSLMAHVVNLGNEVSLHIHKGMHHARMVQLCEQISEQCEISVEDAHKQILLMAEEASVIAKTYGAESLLKALPQREAIEAKHSTQSTGYELSQYLNQMHTLMIDGESMSAVMQCAVLALHEGAGMQRAAIAMMDYDSKCLDVRYIAGKGTNHWREDGRIELERLHKGELLHEFLRAQHPLWHESDKDATPPGILRKITEGGDCMLGGLKLDKRIVAVVYADAAGKAMTERQFEEFQLVVNQLNLMLRINAVDR